MWLNYGNEDTWTANNFVLIDGEFAQSQPKANFRSISSINFKWLTDKNITLNVPKTTTSSGLFIFNSASDVELYYHDAEIKGLNLFYK